MLLDYFRQYMKITTSLSDKSIGHYISGINVINTLLEKYNCPVKNIFSTSAVQELEIIRAFLETNDEFMAKDSIGHHMYSVAFNHFYDFARDDCNFFHENMSAMDIAIKKPTRVTVTANQWQRNQIIISHVIEAAHYMCENNPAHLTFISQRTGKAYMEGHHLIPLKFQSKFDCGLDIYANIVCLCPTCHRMIHFGCDVDRKIFAESFYEKRNVRLMQCGIDLSKKEFLELVLS